MKNKTGVISGAESAPTPVHHRFYLGTYCLVASFRFSSLVLFVCLFVCFCNCLSIFFFCLSLYCLSLDVYIYIFYNTQRGDSWDYYCYCKWFNFNKMVSMVFSKQSIFIVVVISNKWNTRLFHMTPLISTTKLTTVWSFHWKRKGLKIPKW